ncbi:MAG: YggS family pyridoxal phosphate-dependent enzyme [Verrucomicrobiota bacterium]
MSNSISPPSFEERLETVRASIARAAAKSGRRSEDVRLVAVTKSRSAETVRAALAAGLEDFGENKVQEARGKIPEVGAGRWHLIGHLQSNKIKLAVELFDEIDSVDSIELAREINRRAEEQAKHLTVLLQVNVAGESQKYGLAPGEIAAAAEEVNALSHLELCGLMAIAPLVPQPELARPTFAGLRACRDATETATGLKLPELSMGMSNDFEVAIEEGATSIRLGTALFGPREKKQPAPEETW